MNAKDEVRRSYTYLLILTKGLGLDSLGSEFSKVRNAEGARENKATPIWRSLISETYVCPNLVSAPDPP